MNFRCFFNKLASFFCDIQIAEKGMIGKRILRHHDEKDLRSILTYYKKRWQQRRLQNV